MKSRIEIVSDWIEEFGDCKDELSALALAVRIDTLYTEDLKRIVDYQMETLTMIIKALQKANLKTN